MSSNWFQLDSDLSEETAAIGRLDGTDPPEHILVRVDIDFADACVL